MSTPVIRFDRSRPSSGVHLPGRVDTPLPIYNIPVEPVGDMNQAVYDKNGDGVIDSVETVTMDQVEGLNDALNLIRNTSGAGGGTETITITNTSGFTFEPGMPVAKLMHGYVPGSSATPNHQIVGLAKNRSIPGDTLTIQLSGYMYMPANAWDEITDTAGGLSIHGTYFVNSSGQLTLNPPDSAPNYLIKLGKSVSNTEFLIDLDISIKL